MRPPCDFNKLREYQLDNQLSLVQLAEKLVLHRCYVSSILNGKTPGPQTRHKIHRFLESVYGKEYYRENTETCEQNSKPEIQNNVSPEISVDAKPKKKLTKEIAHKTPPKAPQVAAKATKAKRG